MQKPAIAVAMMLGFALLGLGASTAEANLFDADPVASQEQVVYEETLRLCRDFGASDSIVIALEGGKDVFNAAIDLEPGRLLKASRSLEALAGNYGFSRALNTCYGNDVVSKRVFVAALITADVSGKVGAGVVILSATKIFSWALKSIGRITPAGALFLEAYLLLGLATEVEAKGAELFAAYRAAKALENDPAIEEERKLRLASLLEKETKILQFIAVAKTPEKKAQWVRLLGKVRESIRALDGTPGRGLEPAPRAAGDAKAPTAAP